MLGNGLDVIYFSLGVGKKTFCISRHTSYFLIRITLNRMWSASISSCEKASINYIEFQRKEKFEEEVVITSSQSMSSCVRLRILLGYPILEPIALNCNNHQLDVLTFQMTFVINSLSKLELHQVTCIRNDIDLMRARLDVTVSLMKQFRFSAKIPH